MATATVHALSTGSLTLPERFFIHPSDPDAKKQCPSMSFLIQHHSTDSKITRIVFDLGLRRDITLYPSALEKHIQSRHPFTTEPDAIASLAAGNLKPQDIAFIILSHVHYDHVGYPKDFSSTNPNLKFLVGPGALDLLAGRTKRDIGSHMVFEPDLLPLDRTIELPPPPISPLDATKPPPPASELSLDTPLITTWSRVPLAPFEHTIDLFGDGAIYLLNAPGHLPGHVNLLVRISSSPLKFVLLAGDAAHDIRLFDGTHDIATWTDDQGRSCCIHWDVAQAKETIGRIARVKREGVEVDGQRAEVEVVFAHDWAWEAKAKERARFFPGQL